MGEEVCECESTQHGCEMKSHLEIKIDRARSATKREAPQIENWRRRLEVLLDCADGNHFYESAIVLGKNDDLFNDCRVCIYCNSREK